MSDWEVMHVRDVMPDSMLLGMVAVGNMGMLSQRHLLNVFNCIFYMSGGINTYSYLAGR